MPFIHEPPAEGIPFVAGRIVLTVSAYEAIIDYLCTKLNLDKNCLSSIVFNADDPNGVLFEQVLVDKIKHKDLDE